MIAGRLVVAVAAFAMAVLVSPLQAAPPSFPTPEAAMAALGTALAANDEGTAVFALFGPEHADELLGGDPASRRVELRQVAALAADGMVLRQSAPDTRIVLMGRDAWPMPIPLVREAGGWHFDAKAGLEEMIDRRIGKNELAAIQILQAYVEAQRLYASVDRNGDEVLEYAQKIASSPDRRDGLYWPPTAAGDESPLGPLLAAAGEVGAERQKGEPFFGYHFRVLTGQGKNPPGGAYSYVINGHMIAGFAMVAWPADYGNSGVMTFLVSHQGQVFQKDLGKDTAKRAAAIKLYDPDKSWAPAED